MALVGTPDYQFWTGSLLRSLAPDVALIAVAALFLAAGWSVVRRWSPTLLPSRQSGMVVVQFTLLLPLLLSVLLLTLQIVLLVHAKFVVNYAAFAAARSAIVMLPSARYSQVSRKSEGFNELKVDDPTSPKMSAIRRAAALACAGISPPPGFVSLVSGAGVNVEAIGDLALVGLLFHAQGGPVSPLTQFPLRAQYALAPENTRVEVKVEHKSDGEDDTSAFALVTTTVTYRYFLTVPFANRLIGKSFVGAWFGGPYYAEIRQQYTLLSETDTIFPGVDDGVNELYDVEVFQ